MRHWKDSGEHYETALALMYLSAWWGRRNSSWIIIANTGLEFTVFQTLFPMLYICYFTYSTQQSLEVDLQFGGEEAKHSMLRNYLKISVSDWADIWTQEDWLQNLAPKQYPSLLTNDESVDNCNKTFRDNGRTRRDWSWSRGWSDEERWKESARWKMCLCMCACACACACMHSHICDRVEWVAEVLEEHSRIGEKLIYRLVEEYSSVNIFKVNGSLWFF